VWIVDIDEELWMEEGTRRGYRMVITLDGTHHRKYLQCCRNADTHKYKSSLRDKCIGLNDF
jgi:hypothetical protein